MQESSTDTSGASKRVALEVSDTGIGMDEQTRRQCLEPFFTTKGERGTGMGLAMVYGMIQRHKAELQIDSVVGAGTTMRCIFVGTSVTTDALDQQRVVKPPSALNILLVDDDPLIIEALQEILKRDGHHIIAVDGGQAGIDTFIATQAQRSSGGAGIDIVITDLGMPHIDGRRVAAAIKAHSPTVPIIMLTGWGQRLLDDGTAPAHVDRVLSKPPKLDELRRTLTELTMHHNVVTPS
jgi:CheY-like chemotaxis protein